MPDHKKKGNGSKKSKLVQVPAGGGASRYVRSDSPAGKRLQKASKALEMKKAGKKLLRSEQLAISKSFNPTKVRQSASSVSKASSKAQGGMSKAIASTKGRRKS